MGLNRRIRNRDRGISFAYTFPKMHKGHYSPTDFYLSREIDRYDCDVRVFLYINSTKHRKKRCGINKEYRKAHNPGNFDDFKV